MFQTLSQCFDFLYTLFQYFVIPEYTAMLFHYRFQFMPKVTNRLALLICIIPTLKAHHRLFNAAIIHWTMITILRQIIDDVICRRATKHQNIKQRITTETIRTVHRNAGALTGGVQTFNHFFGRIFNRHHHLAVSIGGNTTHRVMRGWKNRDCRFRWINAQKCHAGLTNTRQAFLNHLLAQMIELQQNVIFILTTTTAFTNLGSNCTTHHITTGQVFCLGRITLHQTLAIAIDQITTLTTCAFGNQHTAPGNTGGMKLEKLHILQWHTGAQCHAQTITGIDHGVGRGFIKLACTTRCQ